MEMEFEGVKLDKSLIKKLSIQFDNNLNTLKIKYLISVVKSSIKPLQNNWVKFYLMTCIRVSAIVSLEWD